jgi:hypothetical protein
VFFPLSLALYIACFIVFALLFTYIAASLARRRREPPFSWDYDTARSEVQASLIRCAAAHGSADFHAIEVEHTKIDTNLPRSADLRFDPLHAALNLLDAWIDSSNHEWRYYEGIGRDDWPKLALALAADISQNLTISNPLLIKHFAKRQSRSRMATSEDVN